MHNIFCAGVASFVFAHPVVVCVSSSSASSLMIPEDLGLLLMYDMTLLLASHCLFSLTVITLLGGFLRSPQGRYIHDPQAGDLIVFPSWLSHTVNPTMTAEYRISWSFNIMGAWA